MSVSLYCWVDPGAQTDQNQCIRRDQRTLQTVSQQVTETNSILDGAAALAWHLAIKPEFDPQDPLMEEPLTPASCA